MTIDVIADNQVILIEAKSLDDQTATISVTGGAPGPQGPAGATGPAGPQGPAATTTFDYGISTSGRIFSYPDARWISLTDDNFGTQGTNQNEPAGTGVDPIYEWNNIGETIIGGQEIVGLDLTMRTNDRVNSPDLEILIAFINPTDPAMAIGGWDNNAEISNTTLFRGSWVNDPVPLGGLVDDYHRRFYPLNFTAPVDGWITIFVKPSRPTADAANDYFYYHSVIQVKATPGGTSGGGGSSSAVEHVQTVPAMVWTIDHNLGYWPDVMVFDTGGDGVSCGVANPSTTRTTLTFSVPMAGTARLT